ncbi:MAG: hypothetical protein JWP11_2056, partial [Frankiales bacterium]|nr:hypothetical protein [Frankiales bacterium]
MSLSDASRRGSRLVALGAGISAVLLGAAGPAWADVTAGSSHPSHTWIWAVVGGLAVAGFLLFHVLHGVLNALPAEVRAPISASVRANSRPLAVFAVIVLWTATYGLYSVAHLTAPTSALSTAASNSTGTAPGVAAGTTPTGTTSTGAKTGAVVPGAAVAPGTTTSTGSTTAAGGSPITGSSNPTTANSTVFGSQSGQGSAGTASSPYHDSTIFKPGATNIRGITKDTVTV